MSNTELIVELLERLDRKIQGLTSSPEYRKIEEWLDLDREGSEDRCIELVEVVSEKLKAIGFHSWPENAVELLNDIADDLAIT